MTFARRYVNISLLTTCCLTMWYSSLCILSFFLLEYEKGKSTNTPVLDSSVGAGADPRFQAGVGHASDPSTRRVGSCRVGSKHFPSLVDRVGSGGVRCQKCQIIAFQETDSVFVIYCYRCVLSRDLLGLNTLSHKYFLLWNDVRFILVCNFTSSNI